MKLRIRIVSIVVLCCMLFSAPEASVSGGSRDEIKERMNNLQKEYEESSRQIEEGKKRLKEKEAQKRDVQKKLKNAEKNIVQLNNTLISIKTHERRLSREIETSKNKLVDIEGSLKSRKQEYAERLRSMYKRQRKSAFELFFSRETLSAKLRGMKIFAAIARADIQMLDNIRETKDAVEITMQSLAKARSSQRTLAKRKERDQLSLEKTIRNRQSLLKEIKHDEELERMMLAEREKEKEQIQAEMEKLRKSITREVNKSNFLDGISDDIKNYNFASRKGKLPWPVKGRVASAFGLVTDPVTKTQTRNRGIEIETKHGEPVFAIGAGIVMRTISLRGYGNLVWVYHPPNHYTIYGHLSDILVNPGAELREGDPVGLAGSTGLIDNSKSLVLLEVLSGRKPENPISWLLPDRTRTSGL